MKAQEAHSRVSNRLKSPRTVEKFCAYAQIESLADLSVGCLQLYQGAHLIEDRDLYLAECKKRALRYLDQGRPFALAARTSSRRISGKRLWHGARRARR